MPTDELHYKYAPVLRFSRGERFFPMPLDAFVGYSALYARGQDAPLVPRGRVTLDDLAGRYNFQDVFLRSVTAGPLQGLRVAAQWGAATQRLIYDWTQNPLVAWSEELARNAYTWFSPKTRSATRLFWWNSLLLPWVNKAQALREDLPRFKLPQDVRSSAVENYEALARNYTYYYRLAPQGKYVVLQYWFFYAYNDWAGGYDGFNDHEGDWEGLHLFFKLDGQRPVEPPAFICYLGHHSRMTKPWEHPDVEKVGAHPVVYVGAGSHACYPQARQYPLLAAYNLVDYATGESFALDHSEWTSRVNLEAMPWLLAFVGSWGTRYWLSLEWLHKTLGQVFPSINRDLDMPGVSAPRGPKFNDEGGERETWSNPAAFAGIV